MPRQARDFFEAYLKGQGKAPAHGSVLAYTQTCPAVAPGGGASGAENWERLHPRTVTMRDRGPLRMTPAAATLQRRRRSTRRAPGGGRPGTVLLLNEDPSSLPSKLGPDFYRMLNLAYCGS